MRRVTSYGTKGTELGALITHRLYVPDGSKPAVIVEHGLNGKPWHFVNFPDPVVDELARRGYPVLCPALADNSWGNNASQTALADAIAYAHSPAVGAKAGPVLLRAGSMGTLVALNYLLAHPADVAAVAVALPAVDLADLHDNGAARGGIDPVGIETAYGGAAGYAAQRAAHNPIENAAAYAPYAGRVRMWYADDDPTTIPSRVLAFRDATGIPAVNMGPGGHAFDPAFTDDVVAFLESHA